MTNRNGRRGWLAGAVLLLLAVCALVVPVLSARAMGMPAATPCHGQAVPSHTSHGRPDYPPLDLTAGERGGDAARHHAVLCAVAVCPLMHAALIPAALSAVHPAMAGPAALPFLPLRQGIGMPPPLPPPRLSV